MGHRRERLRDLHTDIRRVRSSMNAKTINSDRHRRRARPGASAQHHCTHPCRRAHVRDAGSAHLDRVRRELARRLGHRSERLGGDRERVAGPRLARHGLRVSKAPPRQMHASSAPGCLAASAATAETRETTASHVALHTRAHAPPTQRRQQQQLRNALLSLPVATARRQARTPPGGAARMPRAPPG